jgi:3-isopropylmalate/(R)-2-methylmalate dehydratase small subunit
VQPFTSLTAVAVPMDEANIDTNQLCPTRYNKVPRGPRFAEILLHDRRFNADGSEKSGFILNRQPYRQPGIIVAGRNFGTGSSRETAVFGLYEFGIRCVIAPSFGDIFRNNCIKNGLLPVELSEGDVQDLMHQLLAAPGASMSVDLTQGKVFGPDRREYAFTIQQLAKRRLLKGLDDIALTQEFEESIARFRTQYKQQFDWLEGGG